MGSDIWFYDADRLHVVVGVVVYHVSLQPVFIGHGLSMGSCASGSAACHPGSDSVS